MESVKNYENINSSEKLRISLENGEENLGKILSLAKTNNQEIYCIAIDEKGIAKTAKRKIEIVNRIYNLAINKYGLDPQRLVFDLVALTVGSGDKEYKNVGKETLEAISEFKKIYPNANTTLEISNISFGLYENNRVILNTVFLNLCQKKGLTNPIINDNDIIDISKLTETDIKICEDLILNKNNNALFNFIKYFSEKQDYINNLFINKKVNNYNLSKLQRQYIDKQELKNIKFHAIKYKNIIEILLQKNKTNLEKLKEWFEIEKKYNGLVDIKFDAGLGIQQARKKEGYKKTIKEEKEDFAKGALDILLNRYLGNYRTVVEVEF